MLRSVSARILGLVAVFGVGTLVVPVAGPAVAAPVPKHVGIVVGGAYACVSWHSGITGDEVLNDVASVDYRQHDHLIDQINGVPNPPYADDTHYWSYWHVAKGSWVYSGDGASAVLKSAGTVEGWSYVNGKSSASPPSAAPGGLYARICGAEDVSVPTSPKPTRRPTSSSSHRSARPPVHAGSARSSSSMMRSSAATASTPANGASAPASSSRRSSAERSDPAGAVGVAILGPGRSSATSSASPELTRLAAKKHPHHGGGSSIPMLIGLGLVALLGGAAAWTARQRSRTG